MVLKNSFTLKRKDKLVKKLKVKFGKDAGEEEEEEQEKTKEPLALTQHLGEEKEEEQLEGFKEGVNEAQKYVEPKKRKAKAQTMIKVKKIAKPSLAKPIAPPIQANTQ